MISTDFEGSESASAPPPCDHSCFADIFSSWNDGKRTLGKMHEITALDHGSDLGKVVALLKCWCNKVFMYTCIVRKSLVCLRNSDRRCHRRRRCRRRLG